jgi:hypothetical protein
MIEEFARVLARAVGLRTQQRREDALQELHNSYQPFFGIAPEVLESIAPEALTALLSAEKPLTPAQADALAQALELEATLHKGFPGSAQPIRQRFQWCVFKPNSALCFCWPNFQTLSFNSAFLLFL